MGRGRFTAAEQADIVAMLRPAVEAVGAKHNCAPCTIGRMAHLVAQKYPPRPRVLVSQIKKRVCERYRISERELISHRRARQYVRPRHIAIYLAHRLSSLSLPQIGRQFEDRDHSTVRHAILNIENLCSRDPVLDSDVRALLAEFGG